MTWGKGATRQKGYGLCPTPGHLAPAHQTQQLRLAVLRYCARHIPLQTQVSASCFSFPPPSN